MPEQLLPLTCLLILAAHGFTDPEEVKILDSFRSTCRHAQDTRVFDNWCVGADPPHCNGRTDPCTGIGTSFGKLEVINKVPWDGLGCEENNATKAYHVTRIDVSNQSLNCNMSALPFDRLTRLTRFEAQHNMFYGQFPHWVLTHKAIAFLNLKHNNLFGAIPPEIEELTTLRLLDISHNRFSGRFPRVKMPTYFSYIGFKHNAFNGTISSEVCPFGQNESLPIIPGEFTCGCPPNSFQNDTLNACEYCPPGTEYGKSACRDCPDGHYSAGYNISLEVFDQNCTGADCGQQTLTYIDPRGCLAAIPGFYVNSSFDKTQMYPCPAGTFAPESASTSCLPCPRGTYSSRGSESCSACPKGTYGSTERALLCAECLPGSHSMTDGQTSCELCNPGSFSDARNTSLCSLCPSSQFTSDFGGRSCQPCPPGMAQSKQGQPLCDPCPPGTFRNASMNACKTCESGLYTPEPGSTACRPCPPGSWNKNSSSCPLCASGFYADVAGLFQCLKCPRGSITHGEGSTKCFKPPGKGQEYHIGNYTYHKVPILSNRLKHCDIGYANDGSAAMCTACGPGTFADQRGMSDCTPCPLGTFASGMASSKCKAAPPGMFVSETGAKTFEHCPLHTFSAGTGNTECSPCTNKTFARTFGSSSCAVLPTGFMLRNVSRPSIQVDLVEAPLATNDSTEQILIYALQEMLLFHELPLEEAQVVFEKERLDTTTNVSITTRKIAITPHNDTSIAVEQIQTALRHRFFETEYLAKALAVGRDTLRVLNSTNQCHTLNRFNFKFKILPPFVAPIPSKCIPGTFFSNTSRECESCPPGSYTDTFGQPKCLPCRVNHIAPNASTAVCERCKDGQHTSDSGQVACTDCPLFVFDMSEIQCNRSKLRVFLLPGIALVVFVILQIRKYLKRAKKRREDEYFRRVELLNIVRANGMSLNQKHRPPMSEITAESILGIDECTDLYMKLKSL